MELTATEHDKFLYGQRIIKILTDAGMIQKAPEPTMHDTIERLQQLVQDTCEAYYSDSTSSREALNALRKFVGMPDEW